MLKGEKKWIRWKERKKEGKKERTKEGKKEGTKEGKKKKKKGWHHNDSIVCLFFWLGKARVSVCHGVKGRVKGV